MIARNLYHILSLIALCAIIAACSARTEIKYTSAPLLPFGSQQSAGYLDDGYVKEAVRDYLIFKKAPLFSQYDFTKKDLNNDGLKDAIIYFKTPYGHWCNTHGCTLLIMKAHPQGFSVIGNIKSVRPPFYISESKSSGWKDLGVYISGKNEKAHTSTLSFDGQKYYMRADNDPDMRHQSFEDNSVFP